MARKSDATEELVDEIAGLERALDKSYTRMRERAWAEWERRHPGEDPSDACVSVRVTPAVEAPAESTSPRRSAQGFAGTKSRQP